MERDVICQLCGASGYLEYLSYCVMCKVSASHRYCLGKGLCSDEEVSWLCDPCKNNPSEFKLQKAPVNCLQDAHVFLSKSIQLKGKTLKKKRRRLILQEDDELDENVQEHRSRKTSGRPSNLFAQPIINYIWRGYFDLCSEKLGPLEAHVSSMACDYVWKTARILPEILQITKHPRLDSWPKSFKTLPPNDYCIALYFFTQDARVEATLHKVVDDVTRNHLSLKVVLDRVELLLFPSTILSEGCQKFQGKFYLWGAFRKRCDLNSHGLEDGCPNPNETIAKRPQTPDFKLPTEDDLNDTSKNITSDAANINLSMQHYPVEDRSSPNGIPEGEGKSDFKHTEEKKFDGIPESCFIRDKQLIDHSMDFEVGEVLCDGGKACSETEGNLKDAEEEKHDNFNENCTIVEKQLVNNFINGSAFFEDQVGNIIMGTDHRHAEGCCDLDEIIEERPCGLDIEHPTYELECHDDENIILVEESVASEYSKGDEIECHDESACSGRQAGEITFFGCLMSCRKDVRLQNVLVAVPFEEQIISKEKTKSSSDDHEANDQEYFGFGWEDEDVGDHQLSLFPEKIEDIAIISRLGGSNDVIDLELGLGQSYHVQDHKSVNDSAEDLFLGSAVFFSNKEQTKPQKMMTQH